MLHAVHHHKGLMKMQGYIYMHYLVKYSFILYFLYSTQNLNEKSPGVLPPALNFFDFNASRCNSSFYDSVSF